MPREHRPCDQRHRGDSVCVFVLRLTRSLALSPPRPLLRHDSDLEHIVPHGANDHRIAAQRGAGSSGSSGASGCRCGTHLYPPFASHLDESSDCRWLRGPYPVSSARWRSVQSWQDRRCDVYWYRRSWSHVGTLPAGMGRGRRQNIGAMTTRHQQADMDSLTKQFEHRGAQAHKQESFFNRLEQAR